MKKIAILGSTGSIGINTLKVVERFSDRFKVTGLAANNNIDLLSKQIKELNCSKAVCHSSLVHELQSRVDKACRILSGLEGMVEISTDPEVDVVLCAVVGTAALIPVLEAIKAGKDIAIASKEILVMAGGLVMEEAKKHGVKMLPVDSEHSAIFQCLEGRNPNDISKLILTASGGAFRNSTIGQIRQAKFRDALNHPTWDMGPKVTVDSASLMNKALEIIEAKWLFDVNKDQIDVVIHPESIVHSMVEFVDGTIIAQMSMTDMKFPIQYALTYPEKMSGGLTPLSLSEIGTLTFRKPDRGMFPSLDFAYKALDKGGTLPCVLNAANEVAVEKLSRDKILFSDIWRIVKETMDSHNVIENPSLKDILAADNWAREFACKI